jgi:hypothetical protein
VKTKNMWYHGIKIISALKLGLAITGFTPLAFFLTATYMDQSPAAIQIGYDFVFWAFFWAFYAWNASCVVRLMPRARTISVFLDLLYVILYWKAFIDVGVPLSALSVKALHGLLPFIFITYLLLPKAKVHFKKSG